MSTEPQPVIIPDVVHGLPTSGPLGTEPAVSIGGVMAFIGALIALLGAFGYIHFTPNQITAIMDDGPQIIGGALAVVALVQAVITRQSVFAPASVARLLAKHKAVPVGN